MNAKKGSLTIFFISLIGWINALYTLWHHVSLNTDGVTKESFCNIGSGFNCDLTAFSSYALFLGLPTAAWGLMFYSCLMVLSIWMLFSVQDQKKNLVRVATKALFVLSSVSLVPTLYLAAVSFFVLKNICLLCVFTYIINIVLFIFIFKSRTELSKEDILEKKAAVPAWVLILGGLLIALSAFAPSIVKSSLKAPKLDDKTLQLYLESHLNSQEKVIVSDASPFQGSPEAKNILVEYSDFQCPFCARSAATLPLVIKEYSDSLKLVFKHFPLDSSCNPHVQRTAHPLACMAAKTALCVFDKLGNEAYLELKHTYFSKQTELSKKLILDTAVSLGFEEKELLECQESLAIHERLLKEVNEAQRIGVQGTPSFFLNGKMVQGAHVPAVLKTVLKYYENKK